LKYKLICFREAFFNEKTGHVKQSGETYTLPKLAETMKIIIKEGSDAVYNGSLTPKLLEDLRKVGGIITEEDLANYK
jgi:gamma-glutamyltranspeptidase/glutathione hydrolase/leukotriene-C4 hydrolase